MSNNPSKHGDGPTAQSSAERALQTAREDDPDALREEIEAARQEILDIELNLAEEILALTPAWNTRLEVLAAHEHDRDALFETFHFQAALPLAKRLAALPDEDRSPAEIIAACENDISRVAELHADRFATSTDDELRPWPVRRRQYR